jgi:hypothetical protein
MLVVGWFAPLPPSATKTKTAPESDLQEAAP